MSERALLARFDLVADNPENIPLLRHYIVDLAIRGKLLEKSALDISAPEMLKRIEAKADSLIKQGKLKKQKPLAPISAEELPATYVAHCTFERLGNVANLQKGLTGIQSAMLGKFPMVVTAAARSTCNHFDFDGAAAIIPMVSSTGHGHASLNRLHYQEGKFALGTILCAVFPIDEELISARFIFEYLTAFKDDLLVSKMNGTANVTLTVGKIAEVPVPIIAPAVQRRVNELMALCDQLHAAQNEREALRDRLVAASLHRIGTAPATADEAETGSEITAPLPEAARFHLAHLSRLTTRPEHIKQLRQTILNLAVRGSLVPQDPNDEPAAGLLKRIQAEKARLIGTGMIREQGPFSTINDDTPAKLPSTWKCVKVVDIAYLRSGIAIEYGDDLTDGKIPYVKVSDLSLEDNNKGIFTSSRFIGEKYVDLIIERGSIVFPKRGGAIATNRKRVTYVEIVCDSNLMAMRPFLDETSAFLQLWFSGFDLWQLNSGTSVPQINNKDIYPLSIPLPPLAEQHRIVAKVDELMALCDQLEAQLTTTQTDSRRLLEAVLRDALAPMAEEATA